MGAKSRGLLLRIVSMLTKMARPPSVTQAGMQTFTSMTLRGLFDFLNPKKKRVENGVNSYLPRIGNLTHILIIDLFFGF